MINDNKPLTELNHILLVQVLEKYDEYTNENKKEHNRKCLYIPDNPYRKLIIRGSRLGKTNALLNLINNQIYIDKIYLYSETSKNLL